MGQVMKLVMARVGGSADGKIVRLGDLGSIYANVSSVGEESEEAVTSNSIRKAYVVVP